MTYFGEVMKDLPAGYWRLGELSGTTVADSSGHGLTSAVVGAGLVLGNAGVLAGDGDTCAYFAGAEYVDLAAAVAMTSTFSLEFWMKPEDPVSDAHIFALGSVSMVQLKDSAKKVSFYYSTSDHQGATPIVMGEWYHVVVSVNAGAMVLYVNGAVDGNGSGVPSGITVERLGAATGGGGYYKGLLDEVAYYSTALSAERVLAHYNAAFRGLVTLRGELRRELHDDDAERWTDLELERHLRRALDDISAVYPEERKTVLTTTPGTRELSMATLDDLVGIERVEYPAGSWPPELVQFETWAGVLVLQVDGAPSSAESVNVYWGRRHKVEERSISLPQAAEETLLLGASGYAMVEWAGYAVNRINVGAAAAAEYAAEGERRLAGFREALRRYGDVSRVRTSSLYAPGRAEPSRFAAQ